MTVEPQYAHTNYKGEPLDDEEVEWCENHRVKLDPFTQLNWKSKESREKWAELHDTIYDAQREAEWRSVLRSDTDREAAIIHIGNHNRETWLKRVGRHGLIFEPIRYTEAHDGFAHKHYETDASDPDRITYAVVAEDEETAQQAKDAELTMQGEEYHDTLGSLLNFPDCCREFFIDHWGDERNEFVDPMYEISCNTPSAERVENHDHEHIVVKDPEPFTNAMYRYFGLRFITHHPCSWECEASAEIGEMRGEIMAENGYREAANMLYEWLYEPMTWEAAKGIANIRNQHITAATNSSGYWTNKQVTWKEPHQPGGSIL